jgi:nickel superoxide dismutase
MKPITAAVIILLGVATSQCLGHCQIPCGIYDDEMRLEMIAENISTIEKAIRQVESLSEEVKPNYNQIVRWTNVKDQHADQISDILSWYFLQQRVKPADQTDAEAYQGYIHKLTLLHQMLVYSMKAKQTTDPANAEMLRSLLGDFEKAYFGHDHSTEHH